jgi:hypothetical protein
LKLSQRRADAVRRYLIAEGMPQIRTEAIGYGQTKPIASNQTPKGRELNRRVMFTIIDALPPPATLEVKQPESKVEPTKKPEVKKPEPKAAPKPPLAKKKKGGDDMPLVMPKPRKSDNVPLVQPKKKGVQP